MCMTRMAHPAFRPNPPALVGPLIIASGALYGLLVRASILNMLRDAEGPQDGPAVAPVESDLRVCHPLQEMTPLVVPAGNPS